MFKILCEIAKLNLRGNDGMEIRTNAKTKFCIVNYFEVDIHSGYKYSSVEVVDLRTKAVAHFVISRRNYFTNFVVLCKNFYRKCLK